MSQLSKEEQINRLSFLNGMSPIDIVFLTVLGEARGEPLEGKVAVLSVIKNRARETKRQLDEIVLSFGQFSCWWEDNSNFNYLKKVAQDLRGLEKPISDNEKELHYVTIGVLQNIIQDNTKAANHYVSLDFYKNASPNHWCKKLQATVVKGNHIFLKE